MQIMLLCGSIAQPSHVHDLLCYLEQLIQKKGVETTFWCLRQRPLPIALPEYHADPLQYPDLTVQTFVRAVQQADGFIFGSPLYHGSFSGVLKNAIDHLAYDALRNKPVGLVSNSGGMRNCTQACEHLRSVVRTLFGYATQVQIGTYADDYHSMDGGYVLVDKSIKQRCAALVQELLLLAHLLPYQTQLAIESNGNREIGQSRKR